MTENYAKSRNDKSKGLGVCQTMVEVQNAPESKFEGPTDLGDRIISKYRQGGKSHVGQTRQRSDPILATLQHRCGRNFVPVQTKN